MRLSSPKLSSPNFFGFAEHGNFESKETTTYLDVPDDDGPAYYFFNNFTVNAGHTITTTRPCKGLYIYVSDIAIINGTITMNNKGVYSPPTGEYINGYTPLGCYDVIGVNFKSNISLPGAGKLCAGTVCSYSSGFKYTKGTLVSGGCGGGGSGNGVSHGGQCNGGAGGMAGVFSGGSSGAGNYYTSTGGGWGGASYSWNVCGCAAEDFGGKGGYNRCTGNTTSYATNIPSGIGNPGYTYQTVAGTSGWYPNNSSSYTGTAGVIYLIARYIGGFNGKLISDGKNPPGASAGGTGGGSITVVYFNKFAGINILNQCSVVAGRNGSNGSKREYQIL